MDKKKNNFVQPFIQRKKNKIWRKKKGKNNETKYNYKHLWNIKETRLSNIFYKFLKTAFTLGLTRIEFIHRTVVVL